MESFKTSGTDTLDSKSSTALSNADGTGVTKSPHYFPDFLVPFIGTTRAIDQLIDHRLQMK